MHTEINTREINMQRGDEAKNAEDWNEFSNVNEEIKQSDFSSVFEFLKVIRYQQKKQKRYEDHKKSNKHNYNLKQIPLDKNLDSNGAAKSPIDIFNKLFDSKGKEDVKKKGITVKMDEPHSLIEEVFSWKKKSATRE